MWEGSLAVRRVNLNLCSSGVDFESGKCVCEKERHLSITFYRKKKLVGCRLPFTLLCSSSWYVRNTVSKVKEQAYGSDI